jgi:hypothetical protein
MTDTFARQKLRSGRRSSKACQTRPGRSVPFQSVQTASNMPTQHLGSFLTSPAQAQTLSLIASSDWPDEYPDLLDGLISLLSTNNPSAVHGAMTVFDEFIKSDLSEDQILPVLRQLLPVLLNILGDQEVCLPLRLCFQRVRKRIDPLY